MMILAVLAQAAAPAAAEIVTLPFSPPLDQPVVEENVVTKELSDGRPGRFIITREYRFERDGDGYLVVMRATGIDTDVEGAAKTGFEVASRPMLNLPLRIRLDAQGRVRGVENAAAYWTAFTDGQMALRQELEGRSGLTTGERRVIAAVVDGLLAVPAADRDAQLAGDVAEMTALAGRTLSATAPIAFEAEGTRAGGSLEVTSIAADKVELRLSAATGDTPLTARVDTAERIVVDRSSGLIVRREKQRTITQGDSVIATTDIRTASTL